MTFRQAEDLLDYWDNNVTQGGSVMPRLSLSRNEGEAVHIDGPARIIVTTAKSGRARLLIEAEHTTRVLREELLTRVRPAVPVSLPPIEECAAAAYVWDAFQDESLGEAG